MRFIFILFALLMAGCAATPPPPQIVYQKIEVPGPTVYCNIKPVEKPVDLVAALKTTDNLHYKAKVLLADRELKEGYITKLEMATISCNQSN
jgi:hypothetical protein